MKRISAAFALAAAVALAGPAFAEEHEILMLNKGEKGMMVFAPDYIRVEPGDTIRFVATDKGHNAETIAGMLPDGAASFKGKFNEEIVYMVEEEGVYGIKCAPHYGMGMVALVVVGDPVNAAEAEAVKHPGKARAVFSDLFTKTVASR